MKPYIKLIEVNVKLAFRERIALFFNYLFPLIFFFGFGQALGSGSGSGMVRVVSMVLVIGILGNGLFGGGIRTVQDREQNILRRFKVAPISPVPLLVASMVTGLLLYLPSVVLTVGLARIVYGMPVPQRWLSLLVLASVGVVAFRAVGLIIAAVANSSQESQILVQLVYLPMLFLTGATVPLAMMPQWAQLAAQFLPGTHLVTGLNGVMLRQESALRHWQPVLVLLATAAVATLISAQIFRWEKGEKLRTSAKLWLLAMILPSLILGAYQVSSRDQIAKTRTLYRDLMRRGATLIQGARIFTGEVVIERGWVHVRDGKIVAFAAGDAPPEVREGAQLIAGEGRTVLPGLIDVRVDLTRTGAPLSSPPATADSVQRALRAYLFCGITAVRNVPPLPPELSRLRESVSSGEFLGAELFLCPSSDVPGCEPFTQQPSGQVWVPREPYIPSLAAVEGIAALLGGNPAPLDRDLVPQAVPQAIVESARRAIEARGHAAEGTWTGWMPRHSQTLLRATSGGAILIAGSGAGSPLVFHGPALQRELALWIKAGVSPRSALRAATVNAAALLRAHRRIGSISAGHDADLVLVEGNPLEDISALERIAEVIFKGERLDREGLLRE